MNDVLEFVVAYFGADPKGCRSHKPANLSSCLYRGPEGRQCAFGIFTLPEAWQITWENDTASKVLQDFGSEVLRPEVEHITDADFWQDIQSLHDHAKHWDLNITGLTAGLTPEGYKKVAQIRHTYSLEPSLPGEPDAQGA